MSELANCPVCGCTRHAVTVTIRAEVKEPADRFAKFTTRARRVLTIAQEEAGRFNHSYIGTEHLLLALCREPDARAWNIVRLYATPEKLAKAVEFIVGKNPTPSGVAEIGLTPRAHKVIELAVDEAQKLRAISIGTEHLLLGLVREGEGIAAGVLESVGCSYQRARKVAEAMPR